jgi:hypothetical protein
LGGWGACRGGMCVGWVGELKIGFCIFLHCSCNFKREEKREQINLYVVDKSCPLCVVKAALLFFLKGYPDKKNIIYCRPIKLLA